MLTTLGVMLVGVPLALASYTAGETLTREPWLRYNVTNGTALDEGTDTEFEIYRDR